jgi:hypothetical protein
MLNKDVNFIRAAFPSPTDTAIPEYYALFGPTTTSATPPVITAEISFILGPTPDAAYSVELHYYYYPESIVQGVLGGLGVITGGTNYINGTYQSVPLTGGSGQYATADIIVAGGVVTTVTVKDGGSFYIVGDVLSASTSNLGNAGSGFSVPVTVINNAAGTSWLGDNFETVLLYGSLREAVIFQKGEQDMVTYYEQKYQESLALLKELGDGKDRRSAYRDGQLRLPVPGPVR